MAENIDEMLERIRRRYDELKGSSNSRKESFLAHVQSLGEEDADYTDHPDPGNVEFPERQPIAYAVCTAECGRAEFIVEGSTQECQRCGRLMFRTETKEYRLVSD